MLKRSYVIVLLLFLCLITALSVYFYYYNKNTHSDNGDKNSQSITLRKVIKYRIEASNPSNRVVDKSSIMVAIPSTLARQRISSLKVSHPYEKIGDNNGNSSINLKLNPFVPYETKLIDITVNVNVDSESPKVSLKNLNEFLKPERFIELNDEKIIKQANLIQGQSKFEQSRNAYDWVTSYLSDSGYIEEDRGALQALKNKTADCTGYMYLYGAMLRAKRIPARMMSGFIIESNKKLNIRDYHNWVEVYLDGKWRIVDPQNKKFLEDESNYVAMRVINNSKYSLFDNSQQLFKSEGKLKINMR